MSFQADAFQNDAFQIEAAVTETPRRGASYLTQAELRRLRKKRDEQEAERDAADRAVGRTIERAYDDIRIAQEAKERAVRLRAHIDMEDEEFARFLIDHHEMLH